MNPDHVVFDPFKRVKRRAPTPAEIERVKVATIRDMASIGGENAIHLLVPMLGAFLWSEHLPPRGPAFDQFMAELKRTIREQIEIMEAATSADTKGHRHAWH